MMKHHNFSSLTHRLQCPRYLGLKISVECVIAKLNCMQWVKILVGGFFRSSDLPHLLVNISQIIVFFSSSPNSLLLDSHQW